MNQTIKEKGKVEEDSRGTLRHHLNSGVLETSLPLSFASGPTLLSPRGVLEMAPRNLKLTGDPNFSEETKASVAGPG